MNENTQPDYNNLEERQKYVWENIGGKWVPVGEAEKPSFINPDGSFKLIDSGKTVNDTFLTGKKFWLTPFENTYVTDYLEAPENTLTIFNQRTGKKLIVSKQLFDDGEFIISQISTIIK